MRVFGVAGRRVDAANTARFPLRNIDIVDRRIRDCLQTARPKSVVASAACGADLLALKASCDLQIPFRIVLPFPPPVFRATSVVDRPGDWGALFDELVSSARDTKNLVVLDLNQHDSGAYRITNGVILHQALKLAKSDVNICEAILVWDGHSYGPEDTTAAFKSSAIEMGMRVREILTS